MIRLCATNGVPCRAWPRMASVREQRPECGTGGRQSVEKIRYKDQGESFRRTSGRCRGAESSIGELGTQVRNVLR